MTRTTSDGQSTVETLISDSALTRLSADVINAEAPPAAMSELVATTAAIQSEAPNRSRHLLVPLPRTTASAGWESTVKTVTGTPGSKRPVSMPCSRAIPNRGACSRRRRIPSGSPRARSRGSPRSGPRSRSSTARSPILRPRTRASTGPCSRAPRSRGPSAGIRRRAWRRRGRRAGRRWTASTSRRAPRCSSSPGRRRRSR